MHRYYVHLDSSYFVICELTIATVLQCEVNNPLTKLPHIFT